MQSESGKFKKRVIVFLIVYAVVFLILKMTAWAETLENWFIQAFSILRPLTIGLITAYLCNPIFRLFERKMLLRLRPSALRRALSLLLTYLTVILIVGLVALLILPQFLESVRNFTSNYNESSRRLIEQLNGTLDSINGGIESLFGRRDLIPHLDADAIRTAVSDFFGERASNLPEYLESIDYNPIRSAVKSTFSVVIDLTFGFFISLYLLASKERVYARVLRLRRALFSDRVNASITNFCTIADRSFGGFLEGKILDSAIIGVLTYIIVLIFRIPSPLLVAAFIGVTNIIPFVGPIIGAIPTAFIILLDSPSKVIPFILIVLFIQQLDGNVIGPAILGNNTGVSSLCVLTAICVMGAMFGFVGMIIGVPLFALILELIESVIHDRLQKKGKPADLENYYADNAPVDLADETDFWTGRLARRLELRGRYLTDRKKEGNTDFSRTDRTVMSVYGIATKYHLIQPATPEATVKMSAEEAEKQAAARLGEAIEAAKRPKTVEIPAEGGERQ